MAAKVIETRVLLLALATVITVEVAAGLGDIPRSIDSLTLG
jgi:hypothetical protein